jgi:hypothetical protein
MCGNVNKIATSAALSQVNLHANANAEMRVSARANAASFSISASSGRPRAGRAVAYAAEAAVLDTKTTKDSKTTKSLRRAAPQRFRTRAFVVFVSLAVFVFK